VGAVEFDGARRTRASLLEERTRELRTGDYFDPAEVEAARLRLARLGVFRRVETVETDTAPGERAVTFVLREEAAWEAAWMLGYGSYEQVRAGVEVSRRNVWGLAHRTRFEAVQSLKGTRADYRYTVPTLFGDTVEATGRVFGLLREEPSFDRVEYGAAVEARRQVPWIEATGTVGFTYEVLSASNVALGTTVDEVEDATVASLDLGLTRDRRDNPIRPTRGVRWSAQAQLARPELGGEVEYERLELAWSWHRPLGEERWLHVGVSQGLLFDRGGDVPVNKLFFPGGESSIRGYAQGEATQRDGAGLFVGVRSAWLVNLEFEQLVTGRWTVVLFADVLGTATHAEDWPGDETLGSAGLGVRYQSPIGPVRLEYGHNVNPRSGDPDGTLHFSIGFPF
jgi:outer membrane protein assembly factor BamA